ncbi:transporter substrate-binding domain-containing protein [Hwanghaeella grinnelliae]|uniref:Transporter substrate-binding domain-containing protein n=1 Tax=Hwanghaeella grinnelliae TaxID=2500179 RepID=A0A437QJA5_9PROT|nr:transporter substrate-binding domain-containing protein [Hwanghaeella grinnelliae]RVU34585.1 transporter substrate-binding domain-containing protein [Hwanghaeella grinnelliae]
MATTAGHATDAVSPRCSPDEKVVLAAEDSFFPYTGVYEEQLRGFSLDIVSAAFEAVGCALDLVQMPYSRCLREVQAGRIDGCFNTTDSEENLQRYLFHKMPLFRGRVLVYGPPSFQEVFTKQQFETATFSVVRGYTYTDVFDGNPRIRKIEVDTDLQTLALVSRGRANFAVVYEKVAQFHIGNNAEKMSPVPRPVAELANFDLFVSFSRADNARSVWLAQALDVGLSRIRGNGVYGSIETTWEEWLSSGVGAGQPAPYWIGGSS